MKHPVGIFYFSLSAGPGRQQIALGDGLVGYVRVDVVDGVPLSDALDCARPAHDEAVMNTHPLTEKELIGYGHGV